MYKHYLGDGVYADYDNVLDCIVLTTENGIEATNTTVIEPEVFKSFEGWWAGVHQKLHEAKPCAPQS